MWAETSSLDYFLPIYVNESSDKVIIISRRVAYMFRNKLNLKYLTENKGESKIDKSNREKLARYNDLIERINQAMSYIKYYTILRNADTIGQHIGIETTVRKRKLLVLIRIALLLSMYLFAILDATTSSGKIFWLVCIAYMTRFEYKQIFHADRAARLLSVKDALQQFTLTDRNYIEAIAFDLNIDLSQHTNETFLAELNSQKNRLQDLKSGRLNMLAFLMGSKIKPEIKAPIRDAFYNNKLYSDKVIRPIFEFAGLLEPTLREKNKKAKTAFLLATHEKSGNESSCFHHFFSPMKKMDRSKDVDNTLSEIFQFAGLTSKT